MKAEQLDHKQSGTNQRVEPADFKAKYSVSSDTRFELAQLQPSDSMSAQLATLAVRICLSPILQNITTYYLYVPKIPLGGIDYLMVAIVCELPR